MPLEFFILAGIWGACMGSFLNAVAHRRVRDRPWWGKERSACESCGHVLGVRDLFPLISWLILKGRCRYCGAKISVRYFLVELLCASMGVIIFWRWKISWACLLSAVGACAIILNSLTDFESMDVFDEFVIFPGLLGLIIRIAGGWPAVLEGLEGAAIGWGIFALIIFLSRGGMGWGDAVFMGGMGAILGLKFILLGLYVGIMIGGFWGIAMLLTGKAKWGRHDSIPLVPFLGAGCFVAMIYGPEIFQYLEKKIYISFSAWPF